ncbi:AraC family transcriptional regulator [Tenacibaculum gallaicum]|uniref:AraC family transcriptional regulator n=1 Tax=Tenacibaculum gallaicum TaxID=561505 RepID=A0A3E0I7H3_9FLAO|nr:helix-turn-helix domain-containing protein [Tenacibaculum gallaicum]REH54693.1 AraC family transcriptional regulator [Tenacibaculum gallaicum]
MTSFQSIKNFYKPIQPSVNSKTNNISYIELKPDIRLENYIYCFWQLKTKEPLQNPFSYRVVSDGCIDIFFNKKHISESFIMGFCRKYVEFPIGNDFDYIGIRFFPSVFPLLFKINAKELSNQSQELKLFLPHLSEWIQTTISSRSSLESIVKLLNFRFINLTQSQSIQNDSRFFKALSLIFHHKGYLDIEKDLNTGLSTRQLQRVFNYYIGTTPKAFSNVVRFQQVLNETTSTQSLKNNKLYLDLGFFDQAHFIKHFKTFYGVPPSKALF